MRTDDRKCYFIRICENGVTLYMTSPVKYVNGEYVCETAENQLAFDFGSLKKAKAEKTNIGLKNDIIITDYIPVSERQMSIYKN